MSLKNKRYLSFDVGGTKISSALVEIGKRGYKVVDFQKTETPDGRDNVINTIIEIALNYSKKGGYSEARIAIAGQVDCEKDIVRYAPNISGFENINLKKIVKEKIGKNVEVDNDVKCFALAENAYGKGKNYCHVVYLTIGTGIGGAVEINNKLYRGANNTAGEFGHMIIVHGGEKCSCGGNGCWERYVSGRAIERLHYNLTGAKKAAAEIAADSAKGNAEDKKVIKEAGLYLATGLVNIVNTVNPELIIIGGSIVKSREIFDIAIEEMKNRVLIPAKKTKIEITDLEDDAFLVGAALR